MSKFSYMHMDMNINTNMDWDINIYGKTTVICEIKKHNSYIIKQFSYYKRPNNAQRTPDVYLC